MKIFRFSYHCPRSRRSCSLRKMSNSSKRGLAVAPPHQPHVPIGLSATDPSTFNDQQKRKEKKSNRHALSLMSRVQLWRIYRDRCYYELLLLPTTSSSSIYRVPRSGSHRTAPRQWERESHQCGLTLRTTTCYFGAIDDFYSVF